MNRVRLLHRRQRKYAIGSSNRARLVCNDSEIATRFPFWPAAPRAETGVALLFVSRRPINRARHDARERRLRAASRAMTTRAHRSNERDVVVAALWRQRTTAVPIGQPARRHFAARRSRVDGCARLPAASALRTTTTNRRVAFASSARALTR